MSVAFSAAIDHAQSLDYEESCIKPPRSARGFDMTHLLLVCERKRKRPALDMSNKRADELDEHVAELQRVIDEHMLDEWQEIQALACLRFELQQHWAREDERGATEWVPWTK